MNLNSLFEAIDKNPKLKVKAEALMARMASPEMQEYAAKTAASMHGKSYLSKTSTQLEASGVITGGLSPKVSRMLGNGALAAAGVGGLLGANKIRQSHPVIGTGLGVGMLGGIGYAAFAGKGLSSVVGAAAHAGETAVGAAAHAGETAAKSEAKAATQASEAKAAKQAADSLLDAFPRRNRKANAQSGTGLHTPPPAAAGAGTRAIPEEVNIDRVRSGGKPGHISDIQGQADGSPLLRKKPAPLHVVPPLPQGSPGVVPTHAAAAIPAHPGTRTVSTHIAELRAEIAAIDARTAAHQIRMNDMIARRGVLSGGKPGHIPDIQGQPAHPGTRTVSTPSTTEPTIAELRASIDARTAARNAKLISATAFAKRKQYESGLMGMNDMIARRQEGALGDFDLLETPQEEQSYLLKHRKMSDAFFARRSKYTSYVQNGSSGDAPSPFRTTKSNYSSTGQNKGDRHLIRHLMPTTARSMPSGNMRVSGNPLFNF